MIKGFEKINEAENVLQKDENWGEIFVLEIFII